MNLYKKINKNTFQCILCNHYCKISIGNFGICKTRQNQNGKIIGIYEGKIISENVDPIEKKPLFNFMKGTFTYSIASLGCNLRCPWCQNYEISQFDKNSKFQDTITNQIINSNLPTKPEEIIQAVKDNNCPSISYTYTEPTLMGNWAIKTMKLANENNLKNIFVSNGYMSKKFLKEILPYLDAINIDLKFMEANKYLKNCGAKLEPILENIKTIYKNKIHIELTTLIIPGLNDSKSELTKIAKFIYNLDSKIPWHISRFFPHYKLSNLEPTDIKILELAQKTAKNIGLKDVYIGNV